MPPSKFRYYSRLNARQKRIYDRSDGVPSLRLPAALPLRDAAERLAEVLAHDDRGGTQTRAQLLVDGILYRLHVPPVEVKVLAVRPSSSRQELHGLYEFGGHRKRPVISVWMRTAQKRHVVAFRTFLRTLLHEVAHHLDYHHLKLEDSYHTQGFYKRAESLYRQIAPPETGAGAAATPREAVQDPAAPASVVLTPTGRIAAPPPAAAQPKPPRRAPAPRTLPPSPPRRAPAPGTSQPRPPRRAPTPVASTAKAPGRSLPEQPEFRFPDPAEPA